MTEAAFSQAQVAEYQAARDVLAGRIRELLHKAESCSDPMERRELDEAVASLSRQRGALQVGSDEVATLLAEVAPQPVPKQATRQAQPQGPPGRPQP